MSGQDPRAQRKPKLRKLDRYPLEREEETLLVLRDPHQIDAPLAVDPRLGPYLELMDGTRSIAQIRQSMLMRRQQSLPLDELNAVVDTLEECGFLEDEAFRARWATALREFIAKDTLEFGLAGLAYPDCVASLQEYLRPKAKQDQELGSSRGAPAHSAAKPSPHAIVCPHPPLQDQNHLGLLQQIPQLLPPAEELEGIVLLCTSHHPGAQPFQLLDKALHSPLGRLGYSKQALGYLSRGRDWLFQEALRFRQEIALELPVLALQNHYGEQCPPLSVVLCGRSGIEDENMDDDDLVSGSAGFLGDLLLLTQQPRWMVVACAELSHTGHAYGHRDDPELESQAALSDQHLFQSLQRRDLSAFSAPALRKLADHCRPSGAACLQSFLSLLSPQSRCGYAQYQRSPAPAGRGYFGQALLAYQNEPI